MARRAASSSRASSGSRWSLAGVVVKSKPSIVAGLMIPPVDQRPVDRREHLQAVDESPTDVRLCDRVTTCRHSRCHATDRVVCRWQLDEMQRRPVASYRPGLQPCDVVAARESRFDSERLPSLQEVAEAAEQLSTGCDRVCEITAFVVLPGQTTQFLAQAAVRIE